MASGSTTNYALPYPLDTDPVNVAGDVEDLAVTIDSILRESIDDASAALITGATVSNGFSTPVYTDNGSSVGSLAFSLAQNIQTSASPTFVGLTLSGDAAVNGGDITTTQTTFNLINTTATTLNIGQAATTVSMGATTGTTTVNNDLNIASGKVFKINSTEVLSATTLGSGVTGSSLTSVGTISSGTWSGTAIAADKGGTGQTSYAIGDLLYASTTTALSKLADVATGNALISGGIGVAPSWGKIDLSTHISGTLAVASGGTGVTSSTGTTNVVLSDSPTFTGAPLSTTAAVDTNTTQIATTAYVVGQGYLKLSGGTLTGALIATAPTTSLASIRLPHGTAPTSPTDGDTWTTTLGLYVQVAGVTVGPLGTGGGGTSGVGLDSVMFLGGM